MTDLEKIAEILDSAGQPHFEYTDIGEDGNYKVMVLKDKKDCNGYVPILLFNLDTKKFIKAAVRGIYQ